MKFIRFALLSLLFCYQIHAQEGELERLAREVSNLIAQHGQELSRGEKDGNSTFS